MLSLGLLRTKFKPSLKAKDLQRFDPTKMGKEPPILVIPERTKPSEEEEGEEKQKVKIKVSEGVTKTFPEFSGGTPEDLIKLIRRQESIIDDMGLYTQYKDLALQLKEKENEVAHLRLSNRGASNDMRDAKEEIKEMKSSMDELKRLAYHSWKNCSTKSTAPSGTRLSSPNATRHRIST